MTTQAQQKYTAEFKENAVKRANESNNVAEIARELGMKENTLYNWVYQYSHASKADKPVRTDEHLYDELKRLKKENARLTAERDLLKKAAAYFAKEIAQLRCKTKRRFKATTNSKHTLPVAPNQLDRQFNVNKPDQAYVSDITYIHTQQGWLYLAVVIDLYSRQIVGWSMAEHMKTTLVNDALIMAIWKRKPAKDLLWHTDRGSQYAADSHRKLLKQHGIQQSLS